jgi:hypothetical protein
LTRRVNHLHCGTHRTLTSELTIAALLGHSARGVTQRYVHIDEALRVAADKVSAELSELLDGWRREGSAQIRQTTE